MSTKITWRIWLLIVLLFFSFLLIFGYPPKFLQKGIIVTSVDANSTAFEQGLRQGQVITSVNGIKTNSVSDFLSVLKGKFVSGSQERISFSTADSQIIYYSNEAPNIFFSDIPKTNLKLGLDMIGGSRALVQAQDKKLSSSEVRDLTDIQEIDLMPLG